MTKLTETAPERIWLQISDEESDNDEMFPCVNGDITWEEGSVLSAEVAYVRADLLEDANARIAELEKERCICRR